MPNISLAPRASLSAHAEVEGLEDKLEPCRPTVIPAGFIVVVITVDEKGVAVGCCCDGEIGKPNNLRLFGRNGSDEGD